MKILSIDDCRIVSVHGGPGAGGGMEPVAEKLNHIAGAIAPIQTADTVQGQIDELAEVILDQCTSPVVLVGHSWGAWLAMLLAAQSRGFHRFDKDGIIFPESPKTHAPALLTRVAGLILVCSGPFLHDDAQTIMKTRLDRLSKKDREQVRKIMQQIKSVDNKHRDDLLKQFGTLLSTVDSFDEIPENGPEIKVDLHIHQQVWDQAAEIRKKETLLDALSKLQCPIAAIHGDVDPHPWKGVRDPLMRLQPQARFHLLQRCGHYPWRERHARDRFFRILAQEVTSMLSQQFA